MRCAIYARKSTEQEGSESVNRQVENARAFAEARGWSVHDDLIFMDDGISGAETIKLVAKQRMLASDFDVLVMQAPDRLSRRDGAEALMELRAISRRAQIWFYSDGTRFETGTLAANVTGYLKSEFAAEFRRAITAKTTEAMRRKALMGKVTGGRAFGYDNVRVGVHVERIINEDEADVVRKIFTRYAAGEGFKAIAHSLNAQHVLGPRGHAWDSGNVRSILRRDLYRGVLVYGKTKKRDEDGARRKSHRPESSWTQVEAPGLRLVDEALADAVDAKLKARRTSAGGRPTEPLHLLSGFIVCACGATFEARRGHYVCSRRRRSGTAVCPSEFSFPVDAIEHSFLNAIEHVVLSDEFIERLLDGAFAGNPAAERDALQVERDRLAREIENLTVAIAAGGDIPALAAALRERDQRFRTLDRQLARPVEPLDKQALRAALELRRGDWRGLLRGPHIAQARQVLQACVELPIRVFNDPKPKWMTHTRGTGLLAGLVQTMASPTGSGSSGHAQTMASPPGAGHSGQAQTLASPAGAASLGRQVLTGTWAA